MAPAGKNLSAVLLLAVLVAIAAGESASVQDDYCDDHHLSGNYKGVCFGVFNDADCKRVCLDESSDNYDGVCDFNLQCSCYSYCPSSGTVATAASAPTPA
ncbi:unnamed protein product [Urochloa decumbens]|uniref:Knottin scorpion toxin-like domain-containing protein n=1 Tax=Urochloa decumbens TaxID=240449 RepID=A0ABC9AMQ5_9POAL